MVVKENAPAEQETAPRAGAPESRPADTDPPEDMSLAEAMLFLSQCSANEAHLVEGLRQLATYNDGRFPKEMKLNKQIMKNFMRSSL